MAIDDSTLKNFSAYLYARCSLSDSTIAGYIGTIRRLGPGLGENPEPGAIDQLVSEMRRRGASYSNVKNTAQAIEKYTGFLGRPVKLARPPKPKRAIAGTLSEAEVTLLIAAAGSPRDRMLIALLACSGLRNQEVCSLRIRDVDIAGQAVRVVGGKGDRDRAACVPGSCMAALTVYLSERKGQPADPLFVTVRRARPLAPQDLRKLIRKAAARAGLSMRVHPHLLRHSLATNMLNRGAGLLAIKQQLGHSFIETTMIYLHAAPARMQEEFRFFAPSYL